MSLGVLVVALAAAAQANVASLEAQREACDAREDCGPETYVQLLLDLGDAWTALPSSSDFLPTESVDSAIKAYDAAAGRSFNALGGESELHSKSLLCLADAYLSKGEYQDAYRRYDGWMQLQDDASQDATLSVLAKQGEAAALGRKNAMAVDTLGRAMQLQEAGDDERLQETGVAARHAWLTMLLAGVHVAMGDGAAALRDVSRALELLRSEAGEGTEDLVSQALGDGPSDGETAHASLETSVSSCMRTGLLIELERTGELVALGIEKQQVHESVLLTFDLQASAARGVGHYEEEGLAEALYKGFVAQLGRGGRTKLAATHTANFFGRGAYEMVVQPPEEEPEDLKEEL